MALISQVQKEVVLSPMIHKHEKAVNRQGFVILTQLIVILFPMQLQDAGCWTDAATLAATHLKGSDYARFVSVLYD